jgi:glutaredoxin 3
VERDINADMEARKELIRRGIRGVPTFLIGDEVVVGFDKARILELAQN